MTVGVGTRAAIDAALAEVNGSASLVTVEPVESYRLIGTVRLHADAAVAPKWRISPPSLHIGAPGSASAAATRVTLVTSEVASRGSRPAYVEFIHQLRREGAAGATAVRGVWGFRGEGEPHGDRVLALRRDVPMVVEVVDSPERAARWVELAHELGCDGDVVYVEGIAETITLE